MVSIRKVHRSKRSHFPGKVPGGFWSLVSLAMAACLQAQVIAYTKSGTIYTADAKDGTNERKVCVGHAPSISNDGRFIAYTRNLPAASETTSKRSMILRELASGCEHTLPASGAEQVYGALWSPDDRWIAFNALLGKHWQTVVVHPDGTGFRAVTAGFGENSVGSFLAGWNRRAKAVLVQNLDQIAQVDPATGKIAWQRPLRDLIASRDISSAWHGTISEDGKFLMTTREVDTEEFKHLDEPSAYLVLTDFPGGKSRRVTPPKFAVIDPWLEPSEKSVLFRGYGQNDVTVLKGAGGVKISSRVYRCDLATGKLTPLVEGGETPSSSRD